MAVDGRSASGKSTLAEVLHRALPGSAVVHTDDVAWKHSFFDWAELLRDGVLARYRRGDAVRFRPPAWQRENRPGAIEVSGDVTTLIVEGVGASRRELVDLIDVAIWVQSDFAEAERRGIARDIASGVNGDADQSTAFWHEWMRHEIHFLAEDVPWERADLVALGTTPEPAAAGEGALWVAPAPPAPRISRFDPR